METSVPMPLKTGWMAVRANAVPMFVLWMLAAGAVLAFYDSPLRWGFFSRLAEWQTEGGWGAAFLNRVVFCGLVPGAFLMCVKSIRPPRPLLTTFVYSLWGGLWGIACDVFFTLQAALFGHGNDMATLVKKTLVDQLGWNVFLCTPVNAVFFPWVARDFRRGQPFIWRRFLLEECPPLLVANWIVWIPVTVAVYVFPLPLQVQLVGLACSFWMLVALRAAAKGDVR